MLVKEIISFGIDTLDFITDHKGAMYMNYKIIFKFLRYTGIPFLIREIVQKRNVTIILFHDIDPTRFESHLKVLKEKYSIISLREYIDSRENDTLISLPSKPLIITFDDGIRTNYLLKPVLKKFNVPITIFLCAGIVGTNRHFWFLHGLKHETIEKLKSLSNAQRLDFLENYGYKEEKEFEDRQAFSKAEIEDLKGIVDFQSHVLYHPVLPKCTDDEADKEITLSKKILEEQYNLNIYVLSYPNGDYGEREILLAKRAGYRYGITLDAGYNHSKTDPFKLKRFCIREDADVDELLVKVSGFWEYIVDFFTKSKLFKNLYNICKYG